MTAESRKGRAFRILLPLVILGAGLLVAQGLIGLRPEPEILERSELERIVTARPLALDSHRTLERFEGTVRPRSVAELRSRIQGTVTRVGEGFREGASVETGELLVELDPFEVERDLREARAALRSEQASLSETWARLKGERSMLETDREILAYAESEVARQERLMERGAVSQAGLDTSRREALEVRLRVEQRRQQIEQAEAQTDRSRGDRDSGARAGPADRSNRGTWNSGSGQ